MKKYIVGAVVIVGVFFVVWYFLSPSMALSGLRDAAIAGDKDELKERIDFASLKESVTDQLKSKMLEEMQKTEGEDSGLEGLGAMIGMGMADTMVDALITPENMAKMVIGREEGGTTDSDEAPDLDIERDGFSKFTVKSKDSKGPSPTLIFKRDGLSWRMTDIDMSEMPFGE